MYDLTKAQAIEEMQKGKKVSHRYFSAHEYITMEYGKIVTEEGYRITPFEFWRWRLSPEWETDWGLFT